MEQELTSILENSTELSFDSYRKIEEGVMTDKYIVVGRKGENGIKEKFIVRFYPKGREHIIKYEPEVLKEATKQNIKVPKLVGTSIEHPLGDLNYIIYEYLPGRPLNEVFDKIDEEKKEKLIENIVANLIMLSKIKCSKYGPLEKGLEGKYDTWNSFMLEACSTGKPLLKKHSDLKDSIISKFEAAILKRNNRVDGNNGLVWLDFHPENIIVNDDNELEGFIDFEEMVSGELNMAIGYLYARDGSSEFYQKIYNEYIKTNELLIEEIEEYSILRLLRIAPYLNTELPSGKKRDTLLKVFSGTKEIISKYETKIENYISALKWIFLINEDTETASSNKQKVKAAGSLIIFSIVITVIFLLLFIYKLDKSEVYKQAWDNSENIELEYSKAPTWFKYEDSFLHSTLPITDELRLKLNQLVIDSIPQSHSYYEAVNILAFNSKQNSPKNIFIILACGLISILGVSIRSLWDFVGHASYKGTLNINRWWSWYLLRPFIGFMAGISFYFLYNGGVLELNGFEVSKSKLYILLGLSALIGFGLNDFVERLRLISKAIFGASSK